MASGCFSALCRSVLPDAARIGRDSVWRLWGWQQKASLPVLVLSAPWLDVEHPDKEGETLAAIAPILRAMLAVCGGDDFTIGVLWDYASLPQPSRSPSEHARFVEALRSLTTWYAHPFTHVLLMTAPLSSTAPSGAEHDNVEREYGARGWCELERRMACTATVRHCLWDMSSLDPATLPASPGCGRSPGGEETGAAEPLVTADVKQLMAIRTWERLRVSLMMQSRPPPLAPPAFAHAMRKKVEGGQMGFLEPTDLSAVLEMYEAGFISIFENYRKVDPSGAFSAFSGMQWSASEGKALAAALAYASEKCKLRKSGTVRLKLEGNDFEEKGEKGIRNAIQFSKVFADVRF